MRADNVFPPSPSRLLDPVKRPGKNASQFLAVNAPGQPPGAFFLHAADGEGTTDGDIPGAPRHARLPTRRDGGPQHRRAVRPRHLRIVWLPADSDADLRA